MLFSDGRHTELLNEYIKLLRQRIDTKNSWGKNEILREISATLEDVFFGNETNPTQPR